MGCANVSTIPKPNFHPMGSIRSALATYDREHFNGTVQNDDIDSKDQGFQATLMDGTVSSPYPDAVTVNQFQVPTPGLTLWQFVQQHLHKAIGRRGQHWEWLIEISTPRLHIKYSEVESKTRSLASALHNLGLRERQTVFFQTKSTALVHLLYFAVWRSKAIVQIADSRGFSIAHSTSDPCFLVYDKTTEGAVIELIASEEKQFVLISVGKVRRSKATNISELFEDAGKSCPDYISGIDDASSVIFITPNGSSHTNTSMVNGFIHIGLLRNAGSYPRQYFFPMASNTNEPDPENSVLTEIFWPIAALIAGKTMVLLDSPIAHSVTVAVREFAVTSICGCAGFLQKISRHIAEQGGSIGSVTSALIQITSRTYFSEKLLRRGFPNLRIIDVVYGFEESLFISSTVPPPSVSDASTEDTDFRTSIPHNSGPLLHPHTTGTLGLFAIAKVVDLDTGVRLGPGEPGELCVKSGTVLKEYIDTADPKGRKTVMDQWVYTGDFGYYDMSGSLYVTGKVQEVFKYYADYIAPMELEFIIQMHPDVRICAVLGIPDALAGSLPCAVVVRRPGSTVSSKELRTFVNSRVSNSKQLRGGIIFLEELPATSELPAFRQKILDYIQKHSLP